MLGEATGEGFGRFGLGIGFHLRCNVSDREIETVAGDHEGLIGRKDEFNDAERGAAGVLGPPHPGDRPWREGSFKRDIVPRTGIGDARRQSRGTHTIDGNHDSRIHEIELEPRCLHRRIDGEVESDLGQSRGRSQQSAGESEQEDRSHERGMGS